MKLVPALVVELEIGFHEVPRLLHDHEQAETELRAHRDGIRGSCGGKRAALERLERPRTYLAARLLHRGAAFHEPGLERFEHQRGVFVEEQPAFVLVDAEPFEFAAREAAADAEDEAPVGVVIDQGDLLGEAHGIVPRHHDDHRAELDALRLPGEVRHQLGNVRADRVVVEVMLRRPDRVHPELFGHQAIAEFLAHEPPVRIPTQVLKAGTVAYMHAISSL